MWRDSAGLHATAQVKVSGVTGPAATRISSAVNTRGLPVYASSYPGEPSLILDLIRASPYPGDTSTFVIEYSWNTPQSGDTNIIPTGDTAIPTLEIGTSLQSIRTDKDADGQQMVVEQTFGTGADAKVVRQVVEVDDDEALIYLRYTRKETQNPKEKAKRFKNKVNSTPMETDAARTWLCKGISGTLTDGGLYWLVVYEFLWREGTWDIVGILRDDNGNPMDGVRDGEGRKLFKVKGEIDFHELNLYLPTPIAVQPRRLGP